MVFCYLRLCLPIEPSRHSLNPPFALCGLYISAIKAQYLKLL